MPEVIKLPSIWDYIADAGTKGIDSYQDARERLRQQQMAQANLATNLFGAGAINSTDLMPALQAVGVNATIQPNQAERQRSVIASPDINPKTGKPWTDDELKTAGLPTSADRLKSQNEVSSETIKSKFLKGESLSEREAKFAGVPTDQELTLGQMQKQDAVLSQIGTKYVDLALAETNGRVPTNWNSVVDKAFAAYTADRQRANLPADPSHRAYFVSQIFDRMVAQRKLDIDALQAKAQMASATRPNITAIDRQFAALTGVVESRRKALDDFATANPTVAILAGNPKYKDNPSVVQYRQLQDSWRRAVNAQAQASSLTPEQAKLLRLEDGGPSPSTPTAQPPRWGAAQHKAAATKIIGKKATLNDLLPLVQSGQISQGDYDAIRELVAQSQRKK